MVSVQEQLQYFPILFQLHFNPRQRPITRRSSSDDASLARHTQKFNLNGERCAGYDCDREDAKYAGRGRVTRLNRMV